LNSLKPNELENFALSAAVQAAKEFGLGYDNIFREIQKLKAETALAIQLWRRRQMGVDADTFVPPVGTVEPPKEGIEPDLLIVELNETGSIIKWKGTEYVKDHKTGEAFQLMYEKRGQPVGIGGKVRKANVCPCRWQ
jgi:hypothetical protein